VRVGVFLCILLFTGCGRNSDPYLESSYLKARTYLDRGELPGAHSTSQRGSFLAHAFGSEAWDWKFRALEAEVQVQRKEPRRALAALSGQLSSSLDQTDTAALVDFERGSAYLGLGDYKTAHRLFDEAERIGHLRGDLALLVSIRLRRGNLAMAEDQDSQAEKSYLEALRLAREIRRPDLEASALTRLGFHLMQRKRFGQAIDALIPAISLSRSLGNRTFLDRNLGNLGWCYFNLGELEPALASLKEAEQIARDINLPDDQRLWLTNTGLIYSSMERYAEAKSYHLRALELARKIGLSAGIAACLHNVAMAELDHGNLTAAQRYNREEAILKHKLGNRLDELYARYTEGTIEDGLKHYAAAEKAFREVADGAKNDPSLRWQALCWLAGNHIELGDGAKARQDYEDAVKTFDDARQQQGRDEFKIAFRSGVNRYYSPYIGFLMNQGDPFGALSVAEASRGQVLAERLGVAPGSRLNLPRIQATAAALHATILSYWLAPKASYLWVITGKDFAAIPLPEASQITSLAESYRRTIASSGHTPDTRLYEMLVAPAQKFIAPGSRVVVVPDAGLFQINFETLLVPGAPQPHYWIEDAVISTATSLALLSVQRHASAKGNILLIGNSISPRPEFPSLPYSATELHSIADRFPAHQRTIYEGPAAVPSAYERARPETYSWIHFAAHAVASKESPLESAIILSDEGDSFKLYARDIAGRPLTADLVTISACYGSGTRTYAGEGIVGLAWAFLLAGAHNVVASLWEANDYYTAQLMDRMYEGLKAGDDPAHALRTAKLSLLHSQYVCRNPRYWGAFQLYTGY
jgi:CHAT domain-containing protein